MQARQFEQVLTQLVKLTRRQRDRLLGLPAPAVKRDETAALIEQCTAMRLVCAGCGSRHFHKHGRASGLQRYRCRACGRTCNGLTGTPLARLRHKERWLTYLSGMLGSTSIRRAAEQLGVTGATTFRWRHRFLALTKADRPSTLGGITEADEMYLLESHKGVRNYLGWRWALDGERIGTPALLLRAALGAGGVERFNT